MKIQQKEYKVNIHGNIETFYAPNNHIAWLVIVAKQKQAMTYETWEKRIEDKKNYSALSII